MAAQALNFSGTSASVVSQVQSDMARRCWHHSAADEYASEQRVRFSSQERRAQP